MRKKKKSEVNSILNLIVTMKLARALDCSFEEAAQKRKAMSKVV